MGTHRAGAADERPRGSHRATRRSCRAPLRLPTLSIAAIGIAVTLVTVGGAVLTEQTTASRAASPANAKRSGVDPVMQAAADRRASLSRDASRVTLVDRTSVITARIEKVQNAASRRSPTSKSQPGDERRSSLSTHGTPRWMSTD